ncbi:carotenoid oxygenase family protein [Paracraurococcus ruber]|uniref:Dioxygenase n=1 Tax=Paracraurococcus ruber TaxID=77675 RepID=A0ABS1D3R9_9PROT|nr:carotenoid oxygenase family protein [Paracraurococcus ruber]MBK1661508.1 carotenoid oxygenase [Paracraurococcus ruber]TDG27299.1 carotenoid oxygenase family protein [Paracraurococcus ruber]
MEDGQAFFAQGNFAPIGTENDVADLPVRGRIPDGLRGTLFRNGPNPQFPPADPAHHHWFLGDGMVHAFTLRDGKVGWRNRWVRTDKWQAEHAAGRALASGFGGGRALGIPDTGVANTAFAWHAGRLLALEEAHLPWSLDPATLETLGVERFGSLTGPFTAHPKTDPVTGELVFFGYSAGGPLSPAMRWGTLSRTGEVTRDERFPVDYCAMVHDFAVTANHVLFPLMPLTGSLGRAMRGGPVFAWEPDLGGQVGLLRRDAGIASLRWFRAEACYAFHVLNAWEDAGGRVLADVMEFAAPPLFPRADGSPSPREATEGRLTRWTLDPAAGTDAFRRERLDEMSGEFPRCDERRSGLPNRHGVFMGRGHAGDGLPMLDTVVWCDLASGGRARFAVPPGDALSEAVFVPRGAEAPEGDGWLLTVAWRAAEGCSELLVLDTQDVPAGPVATVRLPERIPHGFHGAWVPAAA